ncbi:uncharacterized protein [Panulirus ornatus]|uniref:uncharacterized protein n=1 Tax=Panulirus ornatus TaxID=150431 RepID=UPI003A8A12F8
MVGEQTTGAATPHNYIGISPLATTLTLVGARGVAGPRAPHDASHRTGERRSSSPLGDPPHDHTGQLPHTHPDVTTTTDKTIHPDARTTEAVPTHHQDVVVFPLPSPPVTSQTPVTGPPPPQQRPWTQRSLRYTRGRHHKRGHDPRHHHFDDPTRAEAADETTTARLEVFSIVLQFIAVVTSLMVTAPMAMVASRWEYRRKRCPLFVEVPPGFSIYWGNEDLTSCKLTAFLPVIVVLLSGTMLLSHCGLLHVWRTKGDPPPFAFSRLYSLITLAIAVVQTALALSVALTLTEGFRQTCIAFDLNLSWNEVAYSCKKNFEDRDESYGLDDLHTFNKIVTGLVGSWACSVTAILITIVYMLRSRLCWCQLVCI